MDWNKECAVVIPCLNEGRGICALVTEVRKSLPQVFVIDDGSQDRTGELAGQAGATVLRNQSSQGKGAALRQGWTRAAEAGFTWVLCMDGDGQHAPADIAQFLDRAAKGDVALVIGNRMDNAQAMPWLRRFVNRWMSRRLSRTARLDLPDSQCGFRLLRLDAWQKISLQTTHFEIESEIILAFARAGFKIDFVPVQVIYKGERSKIHPFKDSVRWFRWMWRQF